MKPNLTHQDKVIITIATTGGLHGQEANPALPEQPDEIVSDFYDLLQRRRLRRTHPRAGQGGPDVRRPQHLQRGFVDGIMGRCSPMITQVGSGIGIWFDEQGEGP